MSIESLNKSIDNKFAEIQNELITAKNAFRSIMPVNTNTGKSSEKVKNEKVETSVNDSQISEMLESMIPAILSEALPGIPVDNERYKTLDNAIRSSVLPKIRESLKSGKVDDIKPILSSMIPQIIQATSASGAATKTKQQMISFFPEIEAQANEDLERLKAETKRRQQRMKCDPVDVEIKSPEVPIAMMDLGPGAIQNQLPAGTIPITVPPMPTMPTDLMTGNEAIYSRKEYAALRYLERDLTKEGHSPRFQILEGGLIAVYLDDKPAKSFTLDLAGKLINNKNKWTPGIMPSNSGYEQLCWYSYDKNPANLFAWINDDILEDKSIIPPKTINLNSHVNLLTIPATSKEDKTNLYNRLYRMIEKGVFANFTGCRFGIVDYKDYQNFNLKMMRYMGYNIPALRYDPNYIINCHNGKVVLP